MVFAQPNTAFKIFALFFIALTAARAKSIHLPTSDNERYSRHVYQQRPIEVPQLEERNVEVKTETSVPASVGPKEPVRPAADQENEIEEHNNLQPSDMRPENVTRNHRTIGDMPDPVIMMENFRKKLKSARSHLEEISHVTIEPLDPGVFVHDPNMVVHIDRTPNFQLENAIENADDMPALKNIEDNLPKMETAEDKIPAAPSEQQSSLSEQPKTKVTSLEPVKDSIKSEDIKGLERSSTTKLDSTNKQECSTAQVAERKLESEEMKTREMDNLLHMRGEINKLRTMMQVLKEHEIRKKLPSDFFTNQHLTEEERIELEELVKNMKEKGLISTTPLDPTNTFARSETFSVEQINSENSEKLSEDVSRLKEVITDLVKRTEIERHNEANLGRLQQQLESQKVEIENLRNLVDKLLPPVKVLTASESELIKHPDHTKAERVRLHEELKKLQNMLSDLSSREKLLRTTSSSSADLESQPLGSFDDNTKDKLNEGQVNDKIMKEKSDEELESFVKMFNSLTHPSENRQGKSIETKVDQLERELRELDNRNLRTRQEMLLEKLERDIQELKQAKPNAEKTDDIQAKIMKLEEDIKKHHQPTKSATVEDKLAVLEKQIKQMSQPQSRDLDVNDGMEQELNKLQLEIDKLSERSDNVLVHEHTNSGPSREQLQDLLKKMIQNSEGDHFAHSKSISAPYPAAIIPAVQVLPVKHTEGNHVYPHIFQLPFCLQKNHQYAETRPDIQESKLYSGSQHTSALQPTQHNVQQHSYPPKETATLQTLPYAPQSTYEEHPAVENYAYDKGLPQSSGIKPQVHQGYQLPENTNTYSQQPTASYRNTGNSAILLREQFPDIKYGKNFPHNVINNSTMTIDEEISRLSEILQVLDEKISKMSAKQPVGDLKRRKKRSIEGGQQDNSMDNMHRRLILLKDRIEKIQNHGLDDSPIENIHSEPEQNSPRRAYDYNDNYGETESIIKLPGVKLKKIQKFDKLFIKIVKFILHKLEISAPYIVQSLFDGDQSEFVPDFEESNSVYDNSYSSSQNSNPAKYRANEFGDVFQSVVGGFGGGGFPGFSGLLGIIPTILFKLLSNFSSFLTILKHNNFFKNFLVPGILILIVDGIMAIMVWWFSPQDDTNSLLADTFSNRNKNNMSFFNDL